MQLEDSFVRYLNDRGYQPIVVPTGSFLPPMVCILDPDRGHYEFRYKLKDALLAGAQELEIIEGPAVDLEKEKVTKAGGEISISFMQKLAAMFGIAGAPELDVSADIDKGATFNFQNVTSKSVLLGPIQDLLAAQVDKTKIPDDEDMAAGNVHVAYAFLYASALERTYSDNFGAKAKVGAEVADVASFKIAGHVEKTNGESQKFDQKTHTNPQPVAFAFKVAQLKYTAIGVTLKGVETPGEGYEEFEGEPEPYLFDTQVVIDFTGSLK